VNAKQNYQSHIIHVQELMEFLVARGIPKRRIWIFTSDGQDPEVDLAVRDRQPEEDFWLIERTPLGRNLRTVIRYESTSVKGKRLHPATKRVLMRWASRAAHKRLRAGDTLLVYVTDHGRKNREDPDNNSISLWGDELSVVEFQEWLARLPKGVRVVSLMSQCYSGSFANAIYPPQEPTQPAGNVCGYFSSSAERRAYGCYPENRGKDNVGHSVRFFEGLRIHGNLVEAHDRVLLTDRTPDVPTRTSDHYLEELLRREAAYYDVEFETFVDDLLAQVGRDDLDYVGEFARVDHIGRAFGSFTPRLLQELEARAADLPRLGRELKSYARRWKAVLDDLKRENLEGFLEVFPAYKTYRQGRLEAELDREEKRRISAALLQDLVAFTRTHPERHKRLEALRKIATESADASYRMEVRQAVALRMRSLLIRIAGGFYLERDTQEAERADFQELAACEDLYFGEKPKPSREERALPPPFPRLADENELRAAVLPGWIGIAFRRLPDETRVRQGLPRGAVRVQNVFEDSPASRAGLRVGDVILGPPGGHFQERNQIREWVMTSIVGETRTLEVLREDETLEVRVAIGPAPI
jgi:hypothetical protein